MNINTTTQTFESLSPHERKLLLEEIEKLVLTGDRNFLPTVREMFDKWCEALGYNDENQKFLLLGTAFPQRVLLSLIYALQDDLTSLEGDYEDLVKNIKSGKFAPGG